MIRAVITPEKEKPTAAPVVTTVGDHMTTIGLVSGILPMPQGTS